MVVIFQNQTPEIRSSCLSLFQDHASKLKPYGEALSSDNLSVSLGKPTGGLKCYQAFVSVVGMGDDINGIIRTCPAPRDGESELACQAGPTVPG